MIRTKEKILGEINNPDTVTLPVTVTVNKFLTGNGNKTITNFTPGPNKLLITDGNGNLTTLDFSGQTNKIIGTDASGNIVLVDRGYLL